MSDYYYTYCSYCGAMHKVTSKKAIKNLLIKMDHPDYIFLCDDCSNRLANLKDQKGQK